MKPIVKILSLSILLGGTVTLNQVQGQTLNTLSAVQFADQSTVFSVSYAGEVLRSTDGGSSWSILSQPTTQTLLGISMSSATTGVAVGGTGVFLNAYGTGLVLTTTNGGGSWVSQTEPVINGIARVLRAVKMVSTNVGFIVGGNEYNIQDGNGVILKTTDGGSSWQTQTSGTAQALYGVDFYDTNNGIAVGGLGTVLQTTNGGSTWTSRTSGVSGPLSSASYGSSTAVTIAGKGGVILHSTNGGSTWTSQSSGSAYDLYGVDFADANLGVAVGSSGTILRTTNGGSTWAKISNPVPSNLIRVTVA